MFYNVAFPADPIVFAHCLRKRGKKNVREHKEHKKYKLRHFKQSFWNKNADLSLFHDLSLTYLSSSTNQTSSFAVQVAASPR